MFLGDMWFIVLGLGLKFVLELEELGFGCGFWVKGSFYSVKNRFGRGRILVWFFICLEGLEVEVWSCRKEVLRVGAGKGVVGLLGFVEGISREGFVFVGGSGSMEKFLG